MKTILTEKETTAKALTVCPDCGEVIPVTVPMGHMTQCPYCRLHFRYVKRVVIRREKAHVA